MEYSIDIHNEKDPYLREIWAMGYDRCYEDEVKREFVMIKTKLKYIKRIPMFRLTDKPYKIMHSILRNENEYSWISEADGSAERFRKLIQ